MRSLPLLLPLLVLLGSPCFAHGFHLELRVEAGEVRGEAYFSDGEPPGEGTWSVRRAGEAEVLGAGKLDTAGRFAWRPSSPGRYRGEVTEIGLHKASGEVEVLAEALAPAPTPSAGASPAASPSATPAAVEVRRERRGRGGRSKVKRLLTGLGGIALLGVGLYRFQRRRRENENENEAEDEDEDEHEAGEPDRTDGPATSSKADLS